jgi:hypothetical protein
MMYELMTGNPPYGNHGGMLLKNGADIPLVEGEYSQRLKDLIYRCVALNTWDRPTAEQIERETNAYLLGVSTPEPEVETPPVTTELNKSEELNLPRKNYKIWGMIGGISGIVAIACLLLLKPKPVDPDPPINDSIDQDRIECQNYVAEADRMLASVEHMMNPIVYDNDSICLEDSLIPAYELYSKAFYIIQNEGVDLPIEEIVDDMKEIEQILESLSHFCEERIKMFEDDKTMEEFVLKFRERKQRINRLN